MKNEEIVRALRTTKSRSKRELLDAAADLIEKLADRCARYAEEIAVLQEKTRWVPVEEKLPDHHEHDYVLVCATEKTEKIDYRNAVTMAFLDGKHFIDVEADCILEGVTHWMPLPAPPKEDTGLTPKDDKRMSNILMDVGLDYNCSWEYVKNWLLDARLRELAEADKDGRVVVLPCKIGDKLYRVFAGEIFEHRVGSMKYFAIQKRWDIETYPFCPFVESSIGKTIFLTREEAEAALEAMKGE